jgi:hypothetical protein
MTVRLFLWALPRGYGSYAQKAALTSLAQFLILVSKTWNLRVLAALHRYTTLCVFSIVWPFARLFLLWCCRLVSQKPQRKKQRAGTPGVDMPPLSRLSTKSCTGVCPHRRTPRKTIARWGFATSKNFPECNRCLSNHGAQATDLYCSEQNAFFYLPGVSQDLTMCINYLQNGL